MFFQIEESFKSKKMQKSQIYSHLCIKNKIEYMELLSLQYQCV